MVKESLIVAVFQILFMKVGNHKSSEHNKNLSMEHVLFYCD